MRQVAAISILGAVLLLLACSAQKEPIAREYQEPPELTALDDSVEAYAASGETSFEGFRSIYEHFLKAYPSSIELHREYQDLFDGFDYNTEKRAIYDSLRRANPNEAMFAYLYGRTLAGDSSRAMIEKSVELDPNFYWGHYGMAYVYRTIDPPDTTSAIAEYEKCVEIDSSNPNPFRQLANLYIAQGKYDDALWAADALAITSPESFLSASLKCDIYRETGDEQAAEKVLLEFANANPDNRSVRRELISMYEDADRWDDVLVYRHQIVGLENDPAVAKFELAEAYLNVDQPDSALGYVAAAAADGFANFRRLTRSPSLAPLYGLEGFRAVAGKVEANADREREERLAPLLAQEEEKKAEALERILDIKAPDFALPNLGGQTVTLESLRGQIVILDFWATWCGPCRMTMPLLQDFVERKPIGVRVFSVNVWESDTSKVRPFLADYGYDFDVLFGNDALPQEYGVSGIPTLFIIDKDGIIRYKHVGYSPYADQFLKWQTESLL